MTNGSVFIVYNYTNSRVVNVYQSIAGVANDTSGSNAVWIIRSPQTQTAIISYLNGVQSDSNTEMVFSLTGPANYSFGNDFEDTYKNMQEAFSWSTNGVADEYRWGQEGQINFFGASFKPNILTTSSNMNYLIIGKDPLAGNSPSMFNIKLVIVLNTPMTSDLYSVCARASQWLEDSKNITLVIGDSRWCSSTAPTLGLITIIIGVVRMEPSFTTFRMVVRVLMKWLTFSPGYGAMTNFFAPFLNHGNVNNLKLVWALGVNDIGFNVPANPFTIFGNLTNLVAKTPLGVSPYVSTVYAVTTNGCVTNVWPLWTGAPLNIQSNITILDRLISSNAFMFAGVPDFAGYFNQIDMNTNTTPQLSLLGVHFDGTSGFIGCQRLASVLEAAYLYPYNQPYSTNLYW